MEKNNSIYCHGNLAKLINFCWELNITPFASQQRNQIVQQKKIIIFLIYAITAHRSQHTQHTGICISSTDTDQDNKG